MASSFKAVLVAVSEFSSLPMPEGWLVRNGKVIEPAVTEGKRQHAERVWTVIGGDEDDSAWRLWNGVESKDGRVVKPIPAEWQTLDNSGLRSRVEAMQAAEGELAPTNGERETIDSLIDAYRSWEGSGRYFLVWAIRACVGNYETRVDPPEARAASGKTTKRIEDRVKQVMADKMRASGMSEEAIAAILAS